jgi:hypothetical protein
VCLFCIKWYNFPESKRGPWIFVMEMCCKEKLGFKHSRNFMLISIPRSVCVCVWGKSQNSFSRQWRMNISVTSLAWHGPPHCFGRSVAGTFRIGSESLGTNWYYQSEMSWRFPCPQTIASKGIKDTVKKLAQLSQSLRHGNADRQYVCSTTNEYVLIN